MKNLVKNVSKVAIVVTSCAVSYKIGEVAEARLNEREDVTDTDRAATLVAVTGVGFSIGLVARAICKKIG